MTTFGALLPALFGLGGIVLLVIGVRQGRRTRTTAGAAPLVVAGSLVGVAVVCFSLCGAGFWHYGGREGIQEDGNPYVCSAWWREVGTRAGSPDDVFRSAPYCHDRAIEAIGPVVGTSIGVGAVAALGTVGVLVRRRRNFDAALRSLAAGSQSGAPD